jgi:hypothetical protein
LKRLSFNDCSDDRDLRPRGDRIRIGCADCRVEVPPRRLDGKRDIAYHSRSLYAFRSPRKRKNSGPIRAVGATNCAGYFENIAAKGRASKMDPNRRDLKMQPSL